MSKKFVMISLAIIAIFGSLLTFYASNLFFGDVSNFGSGSPTIFATFPAMLLGATLIAAALFVVRFYQRPNSIRFLLGARLRPVVHLRGPQSRHR